jgi:serine/threonine protein phosphatase 1
LERVLSMATIAVGDIHGNVLALDDLLGQLRPVVGERDVVVFLGDYIDRGPATKDCVDSLLRFREAVPAEVVCLCGNHEDWMLRTLGDYRRNSWIMGMEALDTVRSYSVEAARALREAMATAGLRLFEGDCALPYERFIEAMPAAHLRFFQELSTYHATSDCVCAHGGLDPLVPNLDVQTRDALLWGKNGFPDHYAGLETVVYGHWNNADVDAQRWPTPRIRGKTIGLDTISHGVLTAIRLPDRRVFQSARHVMSRGV